jgi:hypothetical protein
MGYDEAAHRKHTKWCCDQLSEMIGQYDFSDEQKKAIKDSVDHLQQTFNDRKTFEAVIEKYVEKAAFLKEKERQFECDIRSLKLNHDRYMRDIFDLKTYTGKCEKIIATYLIEIAIKSIGRKWFSAKFLKKRVNHIIYGKYSSDFFGGKMNLSATHIDRAAQELVGDALKNLDRHPKNGMYRSPQPQPGA